MLNNKWQVARLKRELKILQHALAEVMFRHGYPPHAVRSLAEASKRRLAEERRGRK